MTGPYAVPPKEPMTPPDVTTPHVAMPGPRANKPGETSADRSSTVEDGASDGPKAKPKVGSWAWFRYLVVHHILHLDDTPHRIAWGVFWGFVIGATPTIGVQFVLYLIVCAIVRANKVSGIIPIWLSNPVTALPLYYSEWMLGRFLITGSVDASTSAWEAIADAIKPRPGQSWWDRLFEFDLWVTVFESFISLGTEIWVGSLVAGVLAGAVGYWVTYRAVRYYRARHPIPSDGE